MNKKTLLATSLMLAFGASGSVHAADTIIFDADGGEAANGDTAIGSFDWAVGSSLADNAIPADQDDTFQLYSHGTLQGFQNTEGNPLGAPSGLNSNFEITFILGHGEIIDSITSSFTVIDNNGAPLGGDDLIEFESTITLAGTDGGFTNFFQIYYDDLTDASGMKSDALSGLGFGDGDVIASGVIDLGSVAGNFTSTFQFVDVDDTGTFTAGDTFAGASLLDSFGIDQWSGQVTVDGEGGSSLGVNLDFQDNAFFKDTITALIIDLFFNTSNVLPFAQTNPSQSFDDGMGGTVALGGSLDLGLVNGLTGPDLLLQTDANNSFITTVPEPGSIALLGLGLSGLGFIGWRRRSVTLVKK